LRVALEQIQLSVRSPGGHIAISRGPDREIRVRVRRGTLDTVSIDQLTSDIRWVLTEALTAYDGAYFAARREVYGPGMGLGRDEMGAADE
jgi:hypothetical protein